MKTIGAFDAKTHFSKLLRDVEQGETFEIHRRGKPVAKLTHATGGQKEGEIQEVLAYFQRVRKHARASTSEITDWIREGRK